MNLAFGANVGVGVFILPENLKGKSDKKKRNNGSHKFDFTTPVIADTRVRSSIVYM